MLEVRVFLGLRTAIYRVDDLETAKRWYSEVLGVGPYFDESFYVGFDVGGFELGLLPVEEDEPVGRGGVTAYWGVEEIRGTVDRLADLGATVESDVKDVGEGILVADLTDPFGNNLGVIYNPHFKIA